MKETKQRIKVLTVMPEFNIAGAEIMVMHLLTSYDKSIIQNICVSFFNIETSITRKLNECGIDVIYLNKKKGFDFKILWALFKLIKKYKPQIIHTHRYALLYTLIPSILFKITRVHTVHNQAEYEIEKKGQYIYHLAFNLFKVYPIALTSNIQTSIKKLYKVDSKVIYNGIDTTNYKIRSNYNYIHPVKFVHIGRFAPVKNHRLLINAFYEVSKKYPESELHLFGEGELFDEIKSNIEAFDENVNIFLHGICTNIPEILGNYDVFVLPSKWEGMPITILEAMACGLVVIASDVGGINNIIVNNMSGILIEVDNMNALSLAMLRTIEDREACENIGKNALIKSVEFTSQTMAKNYTNYFIELLNI